MFKLRKGERGQEKKTFSIGNAIMLQSSKFKQLIHEIHVSDLHDFKEIGNVSSEVQSSIEIICNLCGSSGNDWSLLQFSKVSTLSLERWMMLAGSETKLLFPRCSSFNETRLSISPGIASRL